MRGDPESPRTKRGAAKRPAGGDPGDGRGRPDAAIEALARALQRPVDRLEILEESEGARLETRFQERWRQASASRDPERALATSTPDRLVVESLFGWLAARLPQGRELVLILAAPGWLVPVRTGAQEALVAAPELVREPGDGVHVMFPDGEFGLALEMVAGRESGPEARLYKVFVWGAPRLSL
jgi:hypothetical protein